MAPSDQPDDFYLAELLAFALRRRAWIAGVPLVCGVVAAVISLLQAPSFTAAASFVPESGRTPSVAGSLSGLASQFGVTLPVSGENSPQFFASIVGSRTLRTSLLEGRFHDPRSTLPADSVTLLKLLRSTSVERGLRDIAELMRVEVDPRTDIVSVRVTTRWPGLSAEVANHVIDLLNRFNSETRRLNATELRRFLEGRVTGSEAQLRQAEDDVRAFLQGNRRFQESPTLQVEYERLQRQVTIRQEVYLTLLRQLEQVRVAEVNNVPTITVVDRAVSPEFRSGPRRKVQTALGFLIGLIVGVSGALVLEWTDRMRSGGAGSLGALAAEWRQLRWPGFRRRTL